MNCRYCGAPLNPEVKFCSTCGRSQQDETVPGAAPPPPPPSSGGTAQTGRWISAGWDLIKGDWMPFVLMTLVFAVVTGCIPLVLNGPLMAGFHIACIRKMMSLSGDARVLEPVHFELHGQRKRPRHRRLNDPGPRNSCRRRFHVFD